MSLCLLLKTKIPLVFSLEWASFQSWKPYYGKKGTIQSTNPAQLEIWIYSNWLVLESVLVFSNHVGKTKWRFKGHRESAAYSINITNTRYFQRFHRHLEWHKQFMLLFRKQPAYSLANMCICVKSTPHICFGRYDYIYHIMKMVLFHNKLQAAQIINIRVWYRKIYIVCQKFDTVNKNKI